MERTFSDKTSEECAAFIFKVEDVFYPEDGGRILLKHFNEPLLQFGASRSHRCGIILL
jgi:hypothetical protein